MQATARKLVTNLESIMAAMAAKIDATAFRSWISPCKINVDENVLSITALNQFSADFIKSVYSNVLESVANDFGLGLSINVNGAVRAVNDNHLETFTLTPAAAPSVAFDNFIASDENAFVISACKKMAAGGASFSPLFIYGAAGCGKTLIANCINSTARGRTLMMTGAQFVSEFARSLREHSAFAFKDFCRNCDTFIMDDVHVLAGKKATTEEFLHLVLDLRNANKNIVLTSNTSPNNLSGFDRRMQSLLASGLVADIALPTKSVRRAMLVRGGVATDVAEHLSARIEGDAHLVMGVALKVKTYAELMNEKVTIDVAERLLSDTLKKSKTPLSMVKSMCDKLGVSYDEICSSSRNRTVVRARQIMMTALKSATKLSLSEIGRICGDRDHATVLYAIGQIEKRKVSDLILSAEIAQMICECK